FPQEVRAGQNSPAMPDERCQQVELLRPERYLLRPASDDPRAEVDGEISDADLRPWIRRGATRAPEQCLDSSQDLEQPTWLDDVIIRAEAEAAQLLLLGAERRHDQDGSLSPLVAEPLQHREATHRRKHQVQDDEVGLRALRELEP